MYDTSGPIVGGIRSFRSLVAWISQKPLQYFACMFLAEKKKATQAANATCQLNTKYDILFKAPGFSYFAVIQGAMAWQLMDMMLNPQLARQM